MDIFAAGAIIAEIFLNGTHLFEDTKSLIGRKDSISTEISDLFTKKLKSKELELLGV